MYFYSLAPIFVVSTKYIDPWVLEFMVSTIRAKIRTSTINNINDFTVSVNTELFKVSTFVHVIQNCT